MYVCILKVTDKHLQVLVNQLFVSVKFYGRCNVVKREDVKHQNMYVEVVTA